MCVCLCVCVCVCVCARACVRACVRVCVVNGIIMVTDTGVAFTPCILALVNIRGDYCNNYSLVEITIKQTVLSLCCLVINRFQHDTCAIT